MAKFKHPVVQWAHEHPILFALFGTTIFFYAPARILGKTIRIAKYGDSTMGNIPGVMSEEDRQRYTGSGNAGAIHYLGGIPSPEAGPVTGGALFREVYDEMCEKARAGEIPKEQVQYYATAKYNKLITDGQYDIVIKTAPGPDQGKNSGDFYRDNRHNSKIYPAKGNNAPNPIASQRLITNSPASPPVAGKVYSERSSSPGSFAVNPSVRNILGEGSVFAGLGLAQKLR